MACMFGRNNRNGCCGRCARSGVSGLQGRRGAGGSRIRCNGGNEDSALAAAAVAAVNPESCGRNAADPQSPRNQPSSCVGTGGELYGATSRPQPVYVNCCDACGGCRPFPLAARDRYWPTFAHPRWLTCEELYSQRLRRR